MKTKLFFYIGVHNTDSEATQKLLYHNREKLLQAGVLYPFQLPHHNGLASQMLAGNLTPADFFRDLLRETEKSGCSTIILSGDNFCRMDNPSDLKRLGSHFDVRVVCYLRRQDLWLEDWYREHVKWPWDRRFSGMSVDEFFQTRSAFPWIDYATTLNAWASAFGKAHIVPHVVQQDAMAVAPEQDFLLLCGIDAGVLEQPKTTDDSPVPTSALECIRLLRLIDKPASSRLVILQAVGKAYRSMNPADTGEHMISLAHRRELLQEYETSNALVARQYFGRTDGVLFREPEPNDTDGWEQGGLPASAELMSNITDAVAYELTDRIQARRKAADHALRERRAKVLAFENRIDILSRRNDGLKHSPDSELSSGSPERKREGRTRMTDPPELVLHIGVHKTGTTFLQGALRDNRDRLLEAGISYGGTGLNQTGGAYELVHQNKAPGAFFEEIRTQATIPGVRKILVSSEEFSPWLHPEKLALLRKEYPVTVVVYLRRQDLWCSSWYQQNVKWPFYPELAHATFYEFLKLEKFHYWIDYRSLLERWAQVFGEENLRVGVYEKDQYGGNLLAHFCGLVGLDRDLFQTITRERPNTALSAGEFEFVRHLTLENYSNAQRNIVLQHIARVFASTPANTIISADQSRRILERYEVSNRYVARHYLKRSDGILFREQPRLDEVWEPPALEAPEILLEKRIEPLFDGLARTLKQVKDKARESQERQNLKLRKLADQVKQLEDQLEQLESNTVWPGLVAGWLGKLFGLRG